jgi:predicted DNA-binding transcriptional regulator YafY
MPSARCHHRPMRYEPSQRLFRLARSLAATRTGLMLDEMAAELEVGRRTAERLRDSLADIFPQLESWDDEEKMRRWRLPGSALVDVVEPRQEALAAIETSARELAMRGETDRVAVLREASTTLQVVMRPDALRRAEPDVAALMEAEGIAMRSGPRPVIAPGVLPTLRRAILGMQLTVVRYAGPDADEPNTRILCPYGILYGGRGWLVAHVDELSDMRLCRLDRIVSIDLLDRGFARREDLDLATYAGQSFGVFQEEPIDVVLRFEPEAAEDAACWMFHPTQRLERERGGSLIVRFDRGVSRKCAGICSLGEPQSASSSRRTRLKLAALADEVVAHHRSRVLRP